MTSIRADVFGDTDFGNPLSIRDPENKFLESKIKLIPVNAKR
jgi:hypothetical protein